MHDSRIEKPLVLHSQTFISLILGSFTRLQRGLYRFKCGGSDSIIPDSNAWDNRSTPGRTTATTSHSRYRVDLSGAVVAHGQRVLGVGCLNHGGEQMRGGDRRGECIFMGVT